MRQLTIASLICTAVVGVAVDEVWATDSHPGQPLKLIFTAIDPQEGQIWASICTEKEITQRNAGAEIVCMRSVQFPATEGAEYIFDDLPPGTYAATAFHDEDDNGQLDFDTRGIPFEATGNARNARGSYGPPSFDQMKIEIAPASAGAGPPVVLVNGRRVSGFREIGRYPVEAVLRVEVFPEEVSLSYGFSADQRVLNFILKPNVQVVALETGVEAPQQGGSSTLDTSGQFILIDGDTRLSLDANGNRRTEILESERDIVFVGNAAEAGFRTLAPAREEWSTGFSAGTGIWGGAAATLSGSFERSTERSRLGIDPISGTMPLRQDQQTDNLNLGLSIASRMAPTTWTLTSNYTVVDVDTATDLVGVNAAGMGYPRQRFASSRRREANADFILNSRVADLAAGALALTAQAGIKSEAQIAEIDDLSARIGRETFSARLSLDAPFLAPGPIPGEISLNANIELENLTDFRTLTTYGYGFVWKPIDAVRIIASATHEKGAPVLSAIGAPRIVTPGVRVFDFLTGQDRFVDIVDGGNPALTSDDRNVVKLGIQIDPFSNTQLRLSSDYTHSTIENETRSFSLLTEEFEAAFPDRVERDASGGLMSFDRRPVIVGESVREELRSGINWTRRLKAKRVRREAGTPAPRRRSGRPGQIRISAYHRWTLRDDVLPAQGIARFDFLNGSAAGRLGGTAEHVIDLSMYRWNEGLGLSANLNYQSGTRVNATEGRLNFSDLTIIDLKLTYELNYANRILRWAPFLEETRVSFGIGNLLNDKVRVRNARGETPLSFQQDAIDPFGRTFEIDLRRRF